ncbi:TRAP transporter small permease subunit [Propylenella binzhouense]|uniref:TRAP transporter small permease protein n=1 Tax=Propylenella binzhouense TaxID=2555902 RepID=A0A964WS10_9HYPH|nr:TRAP transporter small permease [Propylenella binzhouense]
MTAIGKILDRLVDVLMWIGCLASALMMVHIAVDVFCRNVLNAPLDGTLEIVSSYYMVTIAFFPLAYVSRSGGQILVDLFTSQMPRRPRARLDTVVYVATAIYLALFLWRSYVTALAKTRQGEVWESAGGFLSVWPSRWIVVVGMAGMLLVTLRLAIAGLARGADGLEAALRKPDDVFEGQE